MRSNRSRIWKDIWDKKGEQTGISLHHIDGFDLLNDRQWDYMIDQVTKPIGLKNGDSVLECGCGAGAFLLSLLKQYPGLKVAGLDYSIALLEKAQINIVGDFFYGDMTNIDFIGNQQYDHALSFSTFHYLSSEESARKAVREMVKVTKPGGTIFIGEVSDLAKRQEALTIRELTHRDHKRVSQADPDHLFLSKELFKDLAKEQHLKLNIIDQNSFDLPFYETAKYRYSVYLRK
jgi:ubiquinone/menaquinone biosynthesis C-methylase UbiE